MTTSGEGNSDSDVDSGDTTTSGGGSTGGGGESTGDHSDATGVDEGTTSDDQGSADESGTTDGGLPSDCDPGIFPPAATDDDGYQRFELCGWTVQMRTELFEDPSGAQVYEELAMDLIVIVERLPAEVVEELRATKLWMELNVSAFPGGVYHPSSQWLQNNGYPTKWASGAQFGVASNFLSWRDQQPAMVLHELAHAWEHQHLNHSDPGLQHAYDEAMAQGLYDAVEHITGGITEAYAKNNRSEYFSELTEAYFWTNDFYPFVHRELQEHDPVGYAAVEQAWGL